MRANSDRLLWFMGIKRQNASTRNRIIGSIRTKRVIREKKRRFQFPNPTSKRFFARALAPRFRLYSASLGRGSARRSLTGFAKGSTVQQTLCRGHRHSRPVPRRGRPLKVLQAIGDAGKPAHRARRRQKLSLIPCRPWLLLKHLFMINSLQLLLNRLYAVA
jgi:hypothetical protein